MIPKGVANTIIVLVTIVWAVNFAAQFVPGIDYHPDVSINGIFTAIVGGALIASRRSGKPDKPEPPDGGAPVPPPPDPPPTTDDDAIPAGKESFADMVQRLAEQARGEQK